MKRFKEIAAILLFALLAVGFTSSAMASSGSGGGPWDLISIFLVTTFFANYNPLILCNYRHLLVSIAGINKSILFQ
ncbi:TPA_asm: hypothetical protein G0D24_06345 [Salmonella enterica subsp. enterica serovar Abortusovis]|uniref:Uncharacterized protein n=1 Tax=Salmonella enterica subsp. enterica serovar Abortusovis TaxID=53961 RepID=A0A738E287_SALET|nr:hypothetical protein [Salmonella enterica subsp. enterica]HAC6653483.1 hypothetical protein [Salmonella enterica subsp. enterica serovar Abortusovis]HAE8719304.1 hypothetical protein [Salmonella enterica subsp. enterica serovar Abortusovis]